MFGFNHYYNNRIYSQTVEYFSTDNGIAPNLNISWQESFNYRFNSLGFRSEELIPNTECIITFGCSHAVGVGVPEEKRFGNIISNKLGYQAYNFGVSGADFYIVSSNIINFFQNNFHNVKPKYIFILWPEIARFSWLEKDQNNKDTINTELSRTLKKDSWQESFMLSWNKNVGIVYLLNTIQNIDLICKLANIPIVQQLSNDIFIYNNIESLRYDKGIFNPKRLNSIFWDRGRDTHFGPITHQKLADSFLQFLE